MSTPCSGNTTKSRYTLVMKRVTKTRRRARTRAIGCSTRRTVTSAVSTAEGFGIDTDVPADGAVTRATSKVVALATTSVSQGSKGSQGSAGAANSQNSFGGQLGSFRAGQKKTWPVRLATRASRLQSRGSAVGTVPHEESGHPYRMGHPPCSGGLRNVATSRPFSVRAWPSRAPPSKPHLPASRLPRRREARCNGAPSG